MTKALYRCLLALLLLTMLTACSQYNSDRAVAASGEMSPPEAMLAYEHQLRIELPAEKIPERMKAVHEACVQARFGTCRILGLLQEGKSAFLTVRVLPAGVEPLIALSGSGDEIASRKTTAEDLAEAVIDNRQKEARLSVYAERLETLSKRPQITVADLITLAREQSDVEQQREALQKESTQQKLRIDTHLLSIDFISASEHSSWRRLDLSLERLLGHFLEGTENALTALAYALPFIILAFPLLILWRYAWRRVFGAWKKTAS
jgi:hypothetical protein